jgi:hypothetical protein
MHLSCMRLPQTAVYSPGPYVVCVPPSKAAVQKVAYFAVLKKVKFSAFEGAAQRAIPQQCASRVLASWGTPRQLWNSEHFSCHRRQMEPNCQESTVCYTTGQ